MNVLEFYNETLTGEPLTQESVEAALEEFGRLAWNHGYKTATEEFGNPLEDSSYYDFLHENDW